MNKTLRFAAEYRLTQFAFWFVPHLSRRTVVRLSRLFGHIAYYGASHLRRTAQANLSIAFADSKTYAEKKAILIGSFQTFALMLIDLFWFAKDADKRIAEYVHFDSTFEPAFNKQPFICITAHAGNWELMGKAGALRGMTLTSVAAPLKNTRLNDLFIGIRSDTGQRIASKRGAVRALLKTLKKNGQVALLLDQNTKPSDGGIFMDFFGLPVPVSSIVAVLAEHTDASLVFAICRPDSEGHYWLRNMEHIQTDDIHEPNKTRQYAAVTQRVLRVIEKEVALNPCHWLWSYKRWKYVEPGHQRSEYPFYAKQLLEVDIAAAERTAEAMQADQ